MAGTQGREGRGNCPLPMLEYKKVTCNYNVNIVNTEHVKSSYMYERIIKRRVTSKVLELNFDMIQFVM